MPQLDKVTFLSQFFWLAFFYLGFYFLILKFFLPKMSRILKLRKRKMSISGEGFGLQENEKVRNNFDTIISKGLNASRTMINDNYQQTFDWLETVQHNTNQTHYQNVNKSYILSVGESSLKDNLALSQASLNIPEKLYTQLLLSKIK